MPLELHAFDPSVDFPALARCMFEAYEDPPQSFFHVFFPTHGSGSPSDREIAIDECAERLKSWHAHDDTSHWQMVVDTDTGRIAGGALWNIYEENPFARAHPSTVTWFPEGGARRFAEKAIENHARPRAKAAQKPHIYLFIIFTHPSFRRKGVGQQFMNWGIEKSQEMHLDIYLDSTPYGRPLYEVNGFDYVEENPNVPVPEADELDEGWKEVQRKVSPFTFWLMRRPVSGRRV
ncbi:acyl-CoA N-acyltransferase [Astrocystis sublimbata]|nr:acyl-CoA N-acyltransferase [Astrocystis sublimbata]